MTALSRIYLRIFGNQEEGNGEREKRRYGEGIHSASPIPGLTVSVAESDETLVLEQSAALGLVVVSM